MPRAFILKRLHSLAGLGLVFFLMEHLLTNSQAVSFFGNSDGSGFIYAVNAIHNLPYLQVIELSLIGLPLFLHAGLGIHYIFTSEPNQYPYARNRAYNLQRLTSWFLLAALIYHVVDMRFLKYPEAENFGEAFLKVLQDTFKNVFLVIFYCIFVIIACFHAFNGLWTFLMTWGITLTRRSQKLALRLCFAIMALMIFLGCMAPIGLYWRWISS